MHLSFVLLGLLAPLAAAQAPSCGPVQANVYYLGDDVASSAADSPSACCTACAANSRCAFYSHTSGNCYLSGPRATRYDFQGITSGAAVRSNSSTTAAPATAAPTRTTVVPVSTSAPVGASSCPPRVRRSWSALTATERTTYINAVAAAMASGDYQRFVNMHRNRMTFTEAHAQGGQTSCVFLFWHRRFLLAFENMLRAQRTSTPSPACLTLPYFDYIQDSVPARSSSASRCTSIQACSAIARDLVIPRATYTRIDWSTVQFPPSTDFVLIQNYLFPSAATNVSTVGNAIETNVHNAMHNALGGDMRTAESPRDPIFYSHHALVDLLHTIYFECRARNLPTSDSRVFASCTIDGRPVGAGTTVNIAEDSASTSADQNAATRAWFAGIPATYGQLTNTNGLGPDASYRYDIASSAAILGNWVRTCGSVARRLDDALSQLPSQFVLHDDDNATRVSADVAKELSWDAKMSSLIAQAGLTGDAASAEKVRVRVLLHHLCFAGVPDFSATFKATMGMTPEMEAPNKHILDDILSHKTPLRVRPEQVAAVNMAIYGCFGVHH